MFQFEQFIVEDVHDVFDFDGLVTSHPIYVPVYHPDEINEIFDRISYGKVRGFDQFHSVLLKLKVRRPPTQANA